MRMIIAALPLLALAACQVTKDEKNDSTTVEYNGDIAENTLDAVGNKAEDIAGKIGNDVEQSADKVENKVDNTNIKVDVDTHKDKATTNSN
ncbi:MAG: hypothetical protein H0W65_10810 [Sphingomonas sp.]|uniref:hypothetical protein n=1 Tax=Sphingomonas sp. TaxID=28214 RepID=UPI0017A0C968|nr:hypothetical protein [Sphingomonas sp.]MBA3668194.1 hypothetical protein [Sphingomonas sp.]